MADSTRFQNVIHSTPTYHSVPPKFTAQPQTFSQSTTEGNGNNSPVSYFGMGVPSTALPLPPSLPPTYPPVSPIFTAHMCLISVR